MESESIFLLDANVFIEAYQRYYAFDIAPSFWDKLITLGETGRIVSIDRIKSELLQGKENDPLALWVRDKFLTCFQSTDNENVFSKYTEIINWVMENNHFTDNAKSGFASVADSWLVAHALANNYIIVTHESYNRDKKNRVLIPNVCEQFGIPYINTFDMLRNCQTTF